jgi:hypothetical protein
MLQYTQEMVRALLEIGDAMRLLCCLLLGWSVLLSDADAQTTKESQDAAVAAIKELGGKVTFDEKNPGKPVIGVDLGRSISATDAGLVHLKDLTNLQSLNLGNTKVTDAGLEHLKGMTNLRELHLYDTQVSDAGLASLKGLTGLQKLGFAGTKVTDAGLVHLKGLTSLQTLWLGRTKVTDAGLVHLKGMTNLRELHLYDAKVSDAGLASLKGLTGLQKLGFGGTKVTDAGLVHLKGLTSLQTLWLGRTKVTDAGLVHLKGMTSLRGLYFHDTKVTDAGLEYLKGLTNLKTLNFRGARITAAGLSDLRAALLKRRIERDSVSQLSSDELRQAAISRSRRVDLPADVMAVRQVWIDDDLPPGAGSWTDWTWGTKPDHPVASGSRSVRGMNTRFHGVYFLDAQPRRRIEIGDKIFAYAYVPVAEPVRTLALKFFTHYWDHQVEWGERSLSTRRYLSASLAGALPVKGQWVQLEVDAQDAGLKPGTLLRGWALLHFGGSVFRNPL